MNLSLLFFSAIASIPAFVLAGLGAIPALGLITILGTLSMVTHDYDRKLTYHRKLARSLHSHDLPFAA